MNPKTALAVALALFLITIGQLCMAARSSLPANSLELRIEALEARVAELEKGPTINLPLIRPGMFDCKILSTPCDVTK